MPRVIQVIETFIERGKGTPESVIRQVRQYHTLEGELLAEHDDWAVRLTDEEIMKNYKDYWEKKQAKEPI